MCAAAGDEDGGHARHAGALRPERAPPPAAHLQAVRYVNPAATFLHSALVYKLCSVFQRTAGSIGLTC